MKFATTLLLLTGLAAATAPARANLIANGGFETGDLTGWVLNGNLAYTLVENAPTDGFTAHGGTHYAMLGPVGFDGTLSQRFHDARGAVLSIGFWLAADGTVPNDFSVWFDGASLLGITDLGPQGWRHYTATVRATGTDVLEFAYRDDPGYLALDDITVAPEAVPEPASLGLFGVGVLGIIVLCRRRVVARRMGERSVTHQRAECVAEL